MSPCFEIKGISLSAVIIAKVTECTETEETTSKVRDKWLTLLFHIQ